ncbi:MAG: class A beta-lactamase-related serine hydrolase [Sphingobacteriales bacterium]|nr:MAG: class A beta-lactamase-related serine hydrolase [Sphingobacteriales bacterium]
MKIFRIPTYISTLFTSLLLCAAPASAKDANLAKVNYADTNTAVNRRIIDSLDRYYNIQVARGFNGSVLVGHKGKVVYKRHFGMADRSTGTPLSDFTSTQLSSTSKPFTATAVLWLHQNKYLDINLPVNAYLKDFPYANITVKMLLNHRSGLPNYTSTRLPRWASKGPMYNLDLQSYYAMYKPKLIATPNTRFNYCNTNYALLGRIIEEVSGIPFKQFMRELIFEPLGMKNTFVFDPQDNYSNRSLSVSYHPNWAIFENNHEDGVYGDKGIYSTVEDMYLWDQSFYNNRILSSQTLKLAYTGMPVDSRGIKKYGLGWRMYDFLNGQKIIFHNGWWHGNNSVFYRFIQENTTIVVLGNKFNKKIYEQGKEVYHILHNIAPQTFQCTFDNGSEISEE